MRVAVLGSNGLIGSAIAERLDVNPLISLVRLPSPRQGGPDVTDRTALREALAAAEAEVVINAAGADHFEGIPADRLFAVNAEGPGNVVSAAAAVGAGGVIHLSSVAVYGNGDGGVITEESAVAPESPYGLSKARGEETAEKAAEGSPVGLVSLRLASVPSTKGRGGLDKLAQSIRRGSFFRVGDGRNRKSFLTLSDAARAVERVLEKWDRRGTTRYNLCGEPVSVEELVEAVAVGVGRGLRSVRIPVAAARAAAVLGGGFLGIPTMEMLERYLSDDLISSDAFKRDFQFVFGSAVLAEITQAVGSSSEASA